MKLKATEIQEEERRRHLFEDSETFTVLKVEQKQEDLWLFYLDDENGENAGSVWGDYVEPEAAQRVIEQNEARVRMWDSVANSVSNSLWTTIIERREK